MRELRGGVFDLETKRVSMIKYQYYEWVAKDFRANMINVANIRKIRGYKALKATE